MPKKETRFKDELLVWSTKVVFYIRTNTYFMNEIFLKDIDIQRSFPICLKVARTSTCKPV